MKPPSQCSIETSSPRMVSISLLALYRKAVNACLSVNVAIQPKLAWSLLNS